MRVPDICNANGYHDTGNWSTSAFPIGGSNGVGGTYFHGDLIHSWAGAANISRPVFQSLEARNGWINESNPAGGPCALDWPTIHRCVDFLGGLAAMAGSDEDAAPVQPFALYCSVIDPHPPYFTNATWLAHIDDAALDVTINATRWQPLSLVHPADRCALSSSAPPRAPYIAGVC